MFTKLLAGPRDESEAADLALASVAERARLAWRAGIALALDPSDTQQVFYLAQALDRPTLPRIAARLAALPAGRELLRARPAIDSRSVDLAALRALPANTLGGAYVRVLDENGLDPDIFQRPPGLPDDLAYVAQRLRQTHDLWHVVTGFDTDVPGEIALQAFTYAQLRQRFSLLIVLFGLLIFTLRHPRVWPMSMRARRVGKQAAWLFGERLEDRWTEPLAALRERLGLSELAQQNERR